MGGQGDRDGLRVDSTKLNPSLPLRIRAPLNGKPVLTRHNSSSPPHTHTHCRIDRSRGALWSSCSVRSLDAALHPWTLTEHLSVTALSTLSPSHTHTPFCLLLLLFLLSSPPRLQPEPEVANIPAAAVSCVMLFSGFGCFSPAWRSFHQAAGSMHQNVCWLYSWPG